MTAPHYPPPDFSPPPEPTIKGYRKLDREDIIAINEIKAAEEQLLRRVSVLQHRRDADQRWVAIGATQIQQGVMALIRSIAKPEDNL